MNAQEELSAALFAAHEAAMDAANDPNGDTLRAWRKATKAAERLVARAMFERQQELWHRHQAQEAAAR